MPQLSLITACYHSAATLPDTLASVRAQQDVDLKYQVIDGGSRDGMVELLQQNGDRINHWISEPDGGIYHALNKGLSLATGEVIGFLHADDIFADERAVARDGAGRLRLAKNPLKLDVPILRPLQSY